MRDGASDDAAHRLAELVSCSVPSSGVSHGPELGRAARQQPLDFVRGPPDSEFQRFIDVDIILGHIL